MAKTTRANRHAKLERMTREELLALLETARTPIEAGRVALRLLGGLMTASPGRRVLLDELPEGAGVVLGAIASCNAAAQSGDLDLALASCGLPMSRDALARLCGNAPPRADDARIPLGPVWVPFWKVVDGVAHDGRRLAEAKAAIGAMPPRSREAAFTALLDDIAAEDVHHLHGRVTLASDPDDPAQEAEDERRLAKTLAALLPAKLAAKLLAKKRIAAAETARGWRILDATAKKALATAARAPKKTKAAPRTAAKASAKKAPARKKKR